MLAIFFKYEFYLINKMNILSNFTVKNFVYNFRFYKNFAISSNKNSDAKEIMIICTDYIAAHKQLNCIDPKK